MCQALGSAFINSHNAPKRQGYYYPILQMRTPRHKKLGNFPQLVEPIRTSIAYEPRQPDSRCHKITPHPEKEERVLAFWSEPRITLKGSFQGPSKRKNFCSQSRMRNRERDKVLITDKK